MFLEAERKLKKFEKANERQVISLSLLVLYSSYVCSCHTV